MNLDNAFPYIVKSAVVSIAFHVGFTLFGFFGGSVAAAVAAVLMNGGTNMDWGHGGLGVAA